MNHTRITLLCTLLTVACGGRIDGSEPVPEIVSICTVEDGYELASTTHYIDGAEHWSAEEVCQIGCELVGGAAECDHSVPAFGGMGGSL